ncbi:MAG: hypothetical protein ACI9KE_003522, partial [Polyangiales bacterium]
GDPNCKAFNTLAETKRGGSRLVVFQRAYQ